MQFSDYKDLLAKGKVADAVLICVMVCHSENPNGRTTELMPNRTIYTPRL